MSTENSFKDLERRLLEVYPRAQAFLGTVKRFGGLDDVSILDMPYDELAAYGDQFPEEGPFWTSLKSDSALNFFHVISFGLNAEARSLCLWRRTGMEGAGKTFRGTEIDEIFRDEEKLTGLYKAWFFGLSPDEDLPYEDFPKGLERFVGDRKAKKLIKSGGIRGITLDYLRNIDPDFYSTDLIISDISRFNYGVSCHGYYSTGSLRKDFLQDHPEAFEEGRFVLESWAEEHLAGVLSPNQDLEVTEGAMLAYAAAKTGCLRHIIGGSKLFDAEIMKQVFDSYFDPGYSIFFYRVIERYRNAFVRVAGNEVAERIYQIARRPLVMNPDSRKYQDISYLSTTKFEFGLFVMYETMLRTLMKHSPSAEGRKDG